MLARAFCVALLAACLAPLVGAAGACVPLSTGSVVCYDVTTSGTMASAGVGAAHGDALGSTGACAGGSVAVTTTPYALESVHGCASHVDGSTGTTVLSGSWLSGEGFTSAGILRWYAVNAGPQATTVACGSAGAGVTGAGGAGGADNACLSVLTGLGRLAAYDDASMFAGVGSATFSRNVGASTPVGGVGVGATSGPSIGFCIVVTGSPTCVSVP